MKVFDCIETTSEIHALQIFDQFSDLHQARVRDEGREGMKEKRERVRV